MRKLECQEQWGAEKLEAQLEVARDGLRGLDRSIRKILGRDVPDGESGPLQSRLYLIPKSLIHFLNLFEISIRFSRQVYT